MNDRVTAAIAAIVLACLPAAGQVRSTGSTRPSDSRWTPPRTPEGQPDLQGVWLSNSATPLERPKLLEGRTVLTDAEVARLKARAAELFSTSDSDFAAGDAAFLAALGAETTYKSTTATGSALEMIEREFDNRTSLITDPPDGRIPPFTAEARQRQASAAAARPRYADGPEAFNNAYRCITTGVPKLGGLYGAGHYGYYQIVQTAQSVVVLTETIHHARVIPLGRRTHLPASIQLWDGDSIGRWEGDSLVVDTTNFSAQSNFMGSSDHLHLVERFTRVSADRIDYEMTFDDPTTWSRTWSAMLPLVRSSDSLFEFACHEGNPIIMQGMLGAARADEQR